VYKRQVKTLLYRKRLFRYIDRNAVNAKIVAHPCDYALGSAARHARQRPTRWLSTRWIADFVDEAAPGDGPWPSRYRRFAAKWLDEGTMEMIRVRISHRSSGVDLLDELVDDAPPRLLSWMKRKAALADGGQLLLPVAGIAHVTEAVERRHVEIEQASDPWPQGSTDPAKVLTAALFRILTGASLERIADLLDSSEPTVRRWVKLHQRMTDEASGYAKVADEVARLAVRSSVGSG